MATPSFSEIIFSTVVPVDPKTAQYEDELARKIDYIFNTDKEVLEQISRKKRETI